MIRGNNFTFIFFFLNGLIGSLILTDGAATLIVLRQDDCLMSNAVNDQMGILEIVFVDSWTKAKFSCNALLRGDQNIQCLYKTLYFCLEIEENAIFSQILLK